MSHTLTDTQASMYATALYVTTEQNILDLSEFSDEMLDTISEMIQSEQRKRESEAKELKDDEMRAEAQADGEQYERELEEANNQI